MADIEYKRLQARVSPKLANKVRQVAKKRDISVSKLIKELLLAEISRDQQKEILK